MHGGSSRGSLLLLPSSRGRNVISGCQTYFGETLRRPRQLHGDTASCILQASRKCGRPAYRSRDCRGTTNNPALRASARSSCCRSPSIASDSQVLIIRPKAASTPPVTTTHVTGLGALQGRATLFPHTDLLPSAPHQHPVPLFTPQGLAVPPQLPSTSLSHFSEQPLSPYPFHRLDLHGHPISAMALPSQPQLPPFRNLYHPFRTHFISAKNHAYAHTAQCSPSVRPAAFPLNLSRCIRWYHRSEMVFTTMSTVYTRRTSIFWEPEDTHRQAAETVTGRRCGLCRARWLPS